ncbi:DUF397 domain-containing protein [Streptomyces hiroshimensis]|uniref:DUF397 domain-containing protein n=1 Tax=Streptomyces hiroshimensis TaxID=66424 RepID=A0ABQ2Z7J0_9ACTN|nr:DUF397 domain-containing protein [Streptomyces hiroshimensis]GGY05022.1 hypothetical protein GCM10010324_59710 [Streptomyces hiroshimensis]
MGTLQIAWQKSTYSAGTTGNECVEVAAAQGTILLRESDAPRVVISSTPGSLGTLIRTLKAREGLR